MSSHRFSLWPVAKICPDECPSSKFASLELVILEIRAQDYFLCIASLCTPTTPGAVVDRITIIAAPEAPPPGKPPLLLLRRHWHG